ncbi:MAG TPA: MASE1 domain-containing protein [Verrucomicrobiae bacterium]
MQTRIANIRGDSQIGLRKSGSNKVEEQRTSFDQLTILRGFFVFVGYYLGARMGLALTFQLNPISVMWPTNVVLFAALLLSPPRSWPFLVLCALPAHLVTEIHSGIPMGMVLCWFVSNTFEALIGAVSIRFFSAASTKFNRMRDIFILFVCAAFLAPFLSSFLDSAFVLLNHWGNQEYWKIWRMRFFSNAFAAFIFLPAILKWVPGKLPSFDKVPWLRVLEGGAAFLGLMTVSLFIFCIQKSGPAAQPALLYVSLPFLLWIAMRFGPAETSAATCCVALIAIWGAVHGHGPFSYRVPEQNALSIQMFFSFMSVTLLLLSIAIGERRRAEERFTKAFHSSPDAMLISRLKDGHIFEMNECCESMFGFRRDETIGRTVDEMNIYASLEDRERLIAAISVKEGMRDLALCLRTRTGELRHTLVSADVEDIGGEDCLITVIHDVSDRKRAEEAQQNLAHASRLTVAGELTAMIAHEINQPLGAIICNVRAAELLLEAENPSLEEIREILSDIRRDDLRADEAIRRIRSLLRKHEMQMKAMDANETITSVVRLLTADALRRRVPIVKDLAESLELVQGDPIYLQQVLLNLILNGIEAMDNSPEESRQITIRTKQKSKETVEVTVADCGHGIGAAKMPLIFDSFYTTKPNGLGLGLAIARSIIEAHTGRIWAENNPGCGATFHFTLRTVPQEGLTCDAQTEADPPGVQMVGNMNQFGEG